MYSGNPLALKLVAESIKDLFSGDVAAFLEENAGLMKNIQDLFRATVQASFFA